MTPAHQQLYLRTLRQLVAAGVPFCVIGTFALHCQCPALAHWPVPDCDILLPNQLETIQALRRCLQEASWEMTLWNEPVLGDLTADQLRGKYYLRAHHAGALLDCTYECDYLSWADVAASQHWQQGVPLASVEHCLLLKAQRNTPADREVIRLCRASPASV